MIIGGGGGDWWSYILSRNIANASGERDWWTGWMAEFLRPDTDRPADFPSGVVSVPVVLIDLPYKDTGILVAGTARFTIEDSNYNRPSVKAEHGWALLLPKDSPMTTTKRKRSDCINPNSCTSTKKKKI